MDPDKLVKLPSSATINCTDKKKSKCLKNFHFSSYLKVTFIRSFPLNLSHRLDPSLI